jgi:ABC-type polysaccharide/polyol phosphate transport system ATPase subunit
MSAISLSGLSKKYPLYARKSDRLKEALDPWGRSFHVDFWALKDVSFSIEAGHTVGVLGMNGSGKSTLLQIISSVLQPTDGEITVNGRVAALLELGAGFNPELSGRENVELNAAIMGLSGRALKERMEEIRAFADIGDFFDQPMRTCSSGMFMRVAFATAIHVDPDVLIIDEALSVGDARFQEKCFRRFRAFQEAGKTILYVTHDRSSIPRLCNQALLLHEGRLLDFGEPARIVEAYARLITFGDASRASDKAVARPGAGSAQAASAPAAASDAGLAAFEDHPLYNPAEVRSTSGEAARITGLRVRVREEDGFDVITPGDLVEFAIECAYGKPVDRPLVGLEIRSKDGVLLFATHTGWHHTPVRAASAGDRATYRFRVKWSLGPGDWFVSFCVAESQATLSDYRYNAVHLQCIEPRFSYTGLAYLDLAIDEVPPAAEFA